MIKVGLILSFVAMIITTDIPAESPHHLIGVWYDQSGLFHRAYDIDSDGIPDFETVRRYSVFQFYDGGIEIVEPYIERFPFIYYVDIDKDGFYSMREMFLDVESDGINGNEVSLQNLDIRPQIMEQELSKWRLI